MWYQVSSWKLDGTPITDVDWTGSVELSPSRWGLLVDVPNMLSELSELETYVTSDNQQYINLRVLVYCPLGHGETERARHFVILEENDWMANRASLSLSHVPSEEVYLNNLPYSLSAAPLLGYVRLTSYSPPHYSLVVSIPSHQYQEQAFHEEDFAYLKISLNVAALIDYYNESGQPPVIFVSTNLSAVKKILDGKRSVGALKGGLISFLPFHTQRVLNYPRGFP